MFSRHYYAACRKTRNYVFDHHLKLHKAEEFVAACERGLGRTVAAQAKGLLINRQSCEDQNKNALFRIMGFAVDCDEFEFALAIGDYLDRHP